MLNMLKSGENMWALFIGHLCLEKLLKAIYVSRINKATPRVHDLYKLAVKCGLDLNEDKKDTLQYITLFNIESRYEDYKRDFAKKCTAEYTAVNVGKIKEIRNWLLQEIKN